MNTASLKSFLAAGLISLAGLLAAPATQAADTNLVGDGGFEGKVAASWVTAVGTWGYLPGNGSAIVETYTSYGSLTASPAGGKFLVMDSDPYYSTTLTQKLTGLTAGQSYTVSFYQAATLQPGYFKGTAVDQHWQVSFGDASFASSVMSITQGTGYQNKEPVPVQWQQQTMTFTATSTSTVLGFMAIGPNGGPPMALLDGVTVTAVTAVPEPSSLVLLLCGAMGLLAAIRLRQRARAD